MPTKICPRCKNELEYKFFHRNLSRKDGVSNWCKKCNNEYGVKTHIRVPINLRLKDRLLKEEYSNLKNSGKYRCFSCDQIKDYSFFGICNSDKWLSIQRKCKECQSAEGKAWRKSNPQVYRERSNKASSNRSYEKLWAQQVIRGHNLRGFDLNFGTKELLKFIIGKDICFYCDCQLYWVKGRKVVGKGTPTLDNVNVLWDRPLELSDFVVSCHYCNTSKGSRNLCQWVDYCKRCIKQDRFRKFNKDMCLKVLSLETNSKASYFL